MKAVIKKDGLYVLQASEEEELVEQARACEQADLELLLYGDPSVKELVAVLRRSLVRLLALEREWQNS